MLKWTETYAKMFLASVSFRFRPVFKEKKIVIPLAITSHIPLCPGSMRIFTKRRTDNHSIQDHGQKKDRTTGSRRKAIMIGDNLTALVSRREALERI